MSSMHRTVSLGCADARSITLSRSRVDEFVRKARWQVRSNDPRLRRARCLDGRYMPGAGVIAMPGADVGLLAIAHAAAPVVGEMLGRKSSAEEIAQAVLDAVGGPANFSYHTDRAFSGSGPRRVLGCGYCRLLFEQGKSFAPAALENWQLALLLDMLEGLHKEHVKPDVVRGGHDEAAVLVVRNVHDLHDCIPLSADDIARAPSLWVLDNYAVLRGIGRKRAFILQCDLFEARISTLAGAWMNLSGGKADARDSIEPMLQDIGAVHVARSLDHLAPGLPRYDVFLDVDTGEALVQPCAWS